MSGDRSLVYLSCETIYYSSYHIKDGGIYDDRILAVSAGDVRLGNIYLETIHS